MTFAELKTAVFRDLDESATSPVFFSVVDVADAINDGYKELSDETEWYERSVIIKLLRQQRHYDLRTLVPEQVLSIGPSFNRTTNRWLTPETTNDLDARYVQWNVVTGQPTAVFQRGLWTVGYWPFPATAVGVVQQYFTAIPPALSADTDVPGFPARFHRALVEYATSELHPQRGEPDRGLASWARYLDYEAGVGDFVAGRVSLPLSQRAG